MAKTNISATIDMFGVICAEISSLEAEKAKLRKALIGAIEVGAAEGDLFRVTISVGERKTRSAPSCRPSSSMLTPASRGRLLREHREAAYEENQKAMRAADVAIRKAKKQLVPAEELLERIKVASLKTGKSRKPKRGK